MRKTHSLLRVFVPAVLLVWGLYTKAHPGYDMFLGREKIGAVKNRTQAEDIVEILRHETGNADLTASLYLRFFRSGDAMDMSRLLEQARQSCGVTAEMPTILASTPLEEEVKAAPGVGTGTFMAPLSSISISSPFGTRDGRKHEGVDLAQEHGADIFAADSGTVKYSGTCEGYGNLIILDHKNGFSTYYAHCSTLLVKRGDMPKKGDCIAKVGTTGNSTGPHLHFEIRKEDKPEDPFLYLSFT